MIIKLDLYIQIDTKVAVINIPLTDIRLLPEKYGLKRWPPVTLKFQLSQVRKKPDTFVHQLIAYT